MTIPRGQFQIFQADRWSVPAGRYQVGVGDSSGPPARVAGFSYR
jgi:hypothetical protein